MALVTSAIATEVAALSVTGLTIKDTTSIPQQVQPRDCPLLFPDPDQFVGASSVARRTFGGPAGAYWEEVLPLTWRYFHTETGAGRGIKDFFQAMLAKRDAIVTALMEGAYTTSGADIRGIGITQFGQVTDPSDAKFFGFLITVTFWQQVHT